MGWEELIEALDELETKRDYDGYFYSIKNAVIILILGSLCNLQNVKRIHQWASTAHISEFLKKEFNNPDAEHRGTMLNVSHCMFYKVVAVGFNTLCYDAERCRGRRVLNPPHE